MPGAVDEPQLSERAAFRGDAGLARVRASAFTAVLDALRDLETRRGIGVDKFAVERMDRHVSGAVEDDGRDW